MTQLKEIRKMLKRKRHEKMFLVLGQIPVTIQEDGKVNAHVPLIPDDIQPYFGANWKQKIHSFNGKLVNWLGREVLNPKVGQKVWLVNRDTGQTTQSLEVNVVYKSPNVENNYSLINILKKHGDSIWRIPNFTSYVEQNKFTNALKKFLLEMARTENFVEQSLLIDEINKFNLSNDPTDVITGLVNAGYISVSNDKCFPEPALTCVLMHALNKLRTMDENPFPSTI